MKILEKTHKKPQKNTCKYPPPITVIPSYVI